MERKRLNKKGEEIMLLNETLGLLLALMVLIFLVWIGVLWWGNYSKKTDLDLAGDTLENYLEQIAYFDKGDVVPVMFSVEGDWDLFAYPHNEGGVILYPRECSQNDFEKCVCVGKGLKTIDGNDVFEGGAVCKKIEFDNFFVGYQDKDGSLTSKALQLKSGSKINLAYLETGERAFLEVKS